MEIGPTTAKIVNQIVNDALNEAGFEYNTATSRARKKMDAKIDKICSRPVTKAQLAVIQKHVANQWMIQPHDYLTKAQQAHIKKARDVYSNEYEKANEKYNKVKRHLTELQDMVCLDLELCEDERMQRNLIHRLRQHDLRKPWQIMG